MIAFFATENDPTCDLILLYMRKYGIKKIVRINKSDIVHDFTCHLSSKCVSSKIVVGKSELDSRNSLSFFFRRGSLSFPPFKYSDSPLRINLFKDKELDSLRESIFWELRRSPLAFGGFSEESRENKVIQLQCAQKVGLAIPETVITTSKSELKAFISEHQDCIIKPITNQTYFTDPSGLVWHSKGTQKLDLRDLDRISGERLFPVLAQKEVRKKYEVRTFFFRKKIWSMAIMSQSNPETALDFRNYDYNKPNRTVPYELDDVVVDQVLSMCKLLDLSTGSIDFIIDSNSEVVFLEINPSGQFSMVSRPCNYYIERFIAKEFCNYDK